MSLPNKKGKLLKGRLLAAPLAILLLSASGCATTQEAELHEAIIKSISVSQKQAIESKISNWFGGLNIYSFTLLSDGEQCVLRNDQSGELTKLENVTCYIVDEA